MTDTNENSIDQPNASVANPAVAAVPEKTEEAPKPSSAQGKEQPKKQAHGEEGPRNEAKPKGRFLLVRYGKLGMLGMFRHSEKSIPPGTTHAVVQTERGMELGQIVSPFCHDKGCCQISRERIDQYCQSSGEDYPINQQGRLVRFATDQDLNEHRHLEIELREKYKYCKEMIERMQLPMKLVTVEHLFGGDRVIYYFMAEGRVDFRDLVKELAHRYQTRIEMRQIGARDEARLVGDFESCGRECCCKNFLKVLQPVNMRMAKVQKATLDPSKISGRCGRLKCCLRYEDEVYTDLAKRMPRVGSTVTISAGSGMVIECQVLTQLVKIRMADNRIIAVPVDEIKERGPRPAKPVERETPPVPEAKVETPPAAELPQEAAEDDADGPEGEEETESAPANDSGANGPDQPRKKRRRRRRRRKGGGNGEAPVAPAQ